MMSDENETPTTAPKYPSNWRIAADYDPNQHLMNLKGRDYLNVQNRLLWFIRDQRDFIVRGLATASYVIRTELVEQDREAGFAHFKTYVRDVMGNEATMYGSESAKDFADYAEKASTKSLGRALLALGYGTAFAPEMDEGDRIVDSPVERKPQPAQPPQQRPFTANPPVIRPAVDESLSKTVASAEEQTKLVEELRKAGHDTQRKAAVVLGAILKRTINVTDLLASESDITMAEVARVNQELTAVAR
jgi:hypothetical protein